MSIIARKIILAVASTGGRRRGYNNPITPIAKVAPANA
jgi:hypothetical protein